MLLEITVRKTSYNNINVVYDDREETIIYYSVYRYEIFCYRIIFNKLNNI